MARDEDRRRVLVIGLDGGSFNLLDPLMEQGVMPNLAQLVEAGVRGELASTIPPVTGPAWVSFLTGKNPAKHGVFDFVKRTSAGPGRQVVNCTDIKGHTLWTLLNHHHLRLGLLNVPVTYPPPTVDGFVIPGLLTPGKDSGFAYPRNVEKELNDLIDDYMIDVKWQHYRGGEEERLLEDLITSTNQKKKAALHFFKQDAWDLAAIVFEGPDRLQHALWHFAKPAARPDSVWSRTIRDGILDFYRALDAALGEVQSLADENTAIVVMSDHGFGSFDWRFYINRWLELEGWLRVRSGQGASEKLKNVVRWLVRRTRYTEKRFSELKRRRVDRQNMYGFLHQIDWSQTKAYGASNTEQGIYLNVAGREPHGVVQPGGEYERMREQIMAQLRELKHPETTQPIVTALYKREEIYDGPFLESAPDIVFVLSEGSCLANVRLRRGLFERVDEALGTGTHRHSGIFVASGPMLKSQSTIDGARIIDVAPTILYLLGLPIPNDMDGSPLRDLFIEEHLSRNPPSFSEPPPLAKTSESALTDDEAEKVKDQLRGLGYLG